MKTVPRVHNYSTYVNHHCRCDVCRAANTAYNFRRRSERPALAADDPRHGRLGTYTNWNCRCEPCTAVHSAYQRSLRDRRRAAPSPRDDERSASSG